MLGDIHNLFGDTDTVEVRVDGAGYQLSQRKPGDTTDVMLDYVGYSLDALRAAYGDKVAAAGLPAAESARLGDALEAGLTGYTYLDDMLADGHSGQARVDA